MAVDAALRSTYGYRLADVASTRVPDGHYLGLTVPAVVMPVQVLDPAGAPHSCIIFMTDAPRPSGRTGELSCDGVEPSRRAITGMPHEGPA